MHLLERYALSCGAKIDKPSIINKFFPLDTDRYITVHFNSKNAKTYDHAQEVIDIIYPILSANNITICQVGAKGEEPLMKCANLVGLTDINQLAYIIKNSLLHAGVDSFPVHLAGHYDIPLVSLYSTNFKESCKPYWGTTEKQILIEPKRINTKPSFSNQESPKSINSINPELIAKHICNLLKLDFKYKYRTILTGDLYKIKMLETVPNQVLDPKQFNTNFFSVRMDYLFDEHILEEQIKICPCAIITNKPINKDLLSRYRNQIIEIVYIVEQDNDPNFVRFLQENGIKYNTVTFLSEELASQNKLKYMEFGLLLEKRQQKPTHVLSEYNNIFYKSSKITLSEGKIYPSFAAYKNNKPVERLDYDPQPIIDCDEFWREIEHFSLLIETK